MFALASTRAAETAAQQATPNGPQSATTRTALNVRLDLAEAYDDNVLGEVVPAATPLTTSGIYTSASPGVDFAFRGSRVQLTLLGQSTLRHYPAVHKVLATTHHVGWGMTAQLTSRTTLSLAQTAAYTPAYLYNLFASLAPTTLESLTPAPSSYAVNDQRSYAYGTTLGVTHSVTPRTELSFTGGVQGTNVLVDLPGSVNLRSSDAGAAFKYSLGRGVKARVGYAYRDAQYSGTLRPIEHDLDAGLEFRRPLSPSRTATFTANVGPRLITTHTRSSGLTASSGPYQYRLTGDASTDYQMSRTWHIDGSYRRGLQFLQTLPAPVFTDGVATSIHGFLTRRVDVVVSAAYTAGQYEFGPAIGSLTTYTGHARIQTGLSRFAAVYAEYVLYGYSLAREIELSPSVPHNLRRNGVRVGLTLWAPGGTEHHAAR
jgi:hypothetical protein